MKRRNVSSACVAEEPADKQRRVFLVPLCRNSHVKALLPFVCIICQREKYIQAHSGCWVKERLVTCESDGETLLNKVTENQDDNILLHIRTVGDLASA